MVQLPPTALAAAALCCIGPPPWWSNTCQPSGEGPDLLALAATHGGRLVTFDQRVGVEVVPATSAANLWVIASD